MSPAANLAAGAPGAAGLEAALNALAYPTTARGPAAWALPLGGAAGNVAVRHDPPWLRLETDPLAEADPGACWRRLEAQARLPGAAKFVLCGRMLRLVAEAPLTAEADAGRVLDEAVESLRAAAGPAAPAARAEAPPEAAPLAPRCAEAGWPGADRPGGACRVELAVPLGAHHALATPRAGGGLHAAATVLAVETAPLGPAARPALAAALLAAGGALRLVRPFAAEDDGRLRAGFEVVLSGGAADAEALDHAFAALSVACRDAAPALELLLQEEIAKMFLEVRGWSDLAAGR